MKIHGYIEGDPQAGIDHQSYTFTLDGLPLDEVLFNDEQREQFRKDFKQILGEHFDAGVTVQFEDECPDCREKHYKHKDDCPAINFS